MSLNIHPPVSSAPAVLLTTGVLVGTLGLLLPRLRERFFGLSRALFVLGLLAIPLSYFTGLWTESTLPSKTAEAASASISAHEGFGRFSLIFAAVPLLCMLLERSSPPGGSARKVFAILFGLSFVALAALTGYTSFLGGSLVFEHAAGVAIPADRGP